MADVRPKTYPHVALSDPYLCLRSLVLVLAASWLVAWSCSHRRPLDEATPQLGQRATANAASSACRWPPLNRRTFRIGRPRYNGRYSWRPLHACRYRSRTAFGSRRLCHRLSVALVVDATRGLVRCGLTFR